MRLRFALLGILTLVLLQVLAPIVMVIRGQAEFVEGISPLEYYWLSIKEHPGMIVGEILATVLIGLAIGYGYEWIWNRIRKTDT